MTAPRPMTPARLSPGRRWVGTTLTVRAMLVTCLVAVIAVVITAAVALPLTLRNATQEARRVLADKARVAANGIEGRTQGTVTQQREAQRAQRVAATLRGQNITVILILDGQADHPGLPPAAVKRIAGGGQISQRLLYQGRAMLVEGRPAGVGDGIVLMSPVETLTIKGVIGRLWVALVAGLIAGVLAGVLLGRRLGRPLREVAVAARRISAGDRAARAPIDEPAEVAEISAALNDLAAALTTSENRQRAFLMSISHELRTPLTAIKGYAEAFADGVIDQESGPRVGQTMLAESEHLGRLIDDLLALARLEADDFPLEVMSVELTALMRAAADAWRARAVQAGVMVHAEFPPHPVWATTDPGRIRQVVDGLVENALRVVPAGRPIVLAVRGGAAAVVEVRDGGPGFTDEDLAVVFDRGVLHERYKRVRAGASGLGLALAARLVTRLGGRIEAGHAAEGGARFTVRLPPGPGV